MTELSVPSDLSDIDVLDLSDDGGAGRPTTPRPRMDAPLAVSSPAGPFPAHTGPAVPDVVTKSDLRAFEVSDSGDPPAPKLTDTKPPVAASPVQVSRTSSRQSINEGTDDRKYPGGPPPMPMPATPPALRTHRITLGQSDRWSSMMDGGTPNKSRADSVRQSDAGGLNSTRLSDSPATPRTAVSRVVESSQAVPPSPRSRLLPFEGSRPGGVRYLVVGEWSPLTVDDEENLGSSRAKLQLFSANTDAVASARRPEPVGSPVPVKATPPPVSANGPLAPASSSAVPPQQQQPPPPKVARPRPQQEPPPPSRPHPPSEPPLAPANVARAPAPPAPAAHAPAPALAASPDERSRRGRSPGDEEPRSQAPVQESQPVAPRTPRNNAVPLKSAMKKSPPRQRSVEPPPPSETQLSPASAAIVQFRRSAAALGQNYDEAPLSPDISQLDEAVPQEALPLWRYTSASRNATAPPPSQAPIRGQADVHLRHAATVQRASMRHRAVSNQRASNVVQQRRTLEDKREGIERVKQHQREVRERNAALAKPNPAAYVDAENPHPIAWNQRVPKPSTRPTGRMELDESNIQAAVRAKERIRLMKEKRIAAEIAEREEREAAIRAKRERLRQELQGWSFVRSKVLKAEKLDAEAYIASKKTPPLPKRPARSPNQTVGTPTRLLSPRGTQLANLSPSATDRVLWNSPRSAPVVEMTPPAGTEERLNASNHSRIQDMPPATTLPAGSVAGAPIGRPTMLATRRDLRMAGGEPPTGVVPMNGSSPGTGEAATFNPRDATVRGMNDNLWRAVSGPATQTPLSQQQPSLIMGGETAGTSGMRFASGGGVGGARRTADVLDDDPDLLGVDVDALPDLTPEEYARLLEMDEEDEPIDALLARSPPSAARAPAPAAAGPTPVRPPRLAVVYGHDSTEVRARTDAAASPRTPAPAPAAYTGSGSAPAPRGTVTREFEDDLIDLLGSDLDDVSVGGLSQISLGSKAGKGAQFEV